MNIRKKVRVRVLLCGFLTLGAIYFLVSSNPVASGVAEVKRPSADLSQKYFKGAKVKEIYRLRLDPGDLLLESIQELINRENITDGAITSGIGTLSECRMHWITTTSFPSVNKIETIKAPLEVSAIHGIIADGVPHLHMTVSDTNRQLQGTWRRAAGSCILPKSSSRVMREFLLHADQINTGQKCSRGSEGDRNVMLAEI